MHTHIISASVLQKEVSRTQDTASASIRGAGSIIMFTVFGRMISVILRIARAKINGCERMIEVFGGWWMFSRPVRTLCGTG